ncbi:MAG: glycosyl hydrolase, partial [Bacteroidota bacterium]
GPAPPAVLASKPGFNRASWDLRRASLPAVDKVFVYGSYSGSMVPSGKYKLRLSTEKVSKEVDVEIKSDPRVSYPAAAVAKQQQMLNDIDAAIADVHSSVNRLRSVKDQLQNRLALIKKLDNMEDLCAAGNTAMQNIKQWEQKLIQAQQKTFQDVINFPNQLNAELMTLKGVVGGQGNPMPTKGAQDRLQDLMDMWKMRKAEMNRIIKEDVGSFNALYQQKKLPVLIVPAEE